MFSPYVATLTRDITAYDLAMDAPEGEEGYPPEFVLGPAGSPVTVIGEEGWELTPTVMLEVSGFANDPQASGYVLPADVQGMF